MAYGNNNDMSNFWESNDWEASSFDDFMQSHGDPGSEGTAGQQILSSQVYDFGKASEAESKRQDSIDKSRKLLLDAGYKGSLGSIRDSFDTSNQIASDTFEGRMGALGESAELQRGALDDFGAALDDFSMEEAASGLEGRAEDATWGALAQQAKLDSQAKESRDAILARVKESEKASDKDYQASRAAVEKSQKQAIQTKEEFDAQSLEHEMAVNASFRQEAQEKINFINSDSSMTPQQRADAVKQVESEMRNQTHQSVGRLVTQRHQQSAALGQFVSQVTAAAANTYKAIGDSLNQRTVANTQVIMNAHNSYMQSAQFGSQLVDRAEGRAAQMYGSAAQMRAQEQQARMEGERFLAQARTALESNIGNAAQAIWKDFGQQKTQASQMKLQAEMAAHKGLEGAASIMANRRYGIIQIGSMFTNFFKTAALARQAGGVEFGAPGGAIGFQDMMSGDPWDATSFLAPPMSNYDQTENQDTFPFPQYG